MPNTSEFHRPLSAVITLPDPDNRMVSALAQQGGTLEWRTDSHHYPNFEIRFLGPNPSNDEEDSVFKGSDVQPVVIRLNKVGEYKHTVRHIREKDGSCIDTGPHPTNVTPCHACPPWGPGGK